ncbi:hypothetical protein AB6A40_003578 [Gnathostoma spinigerum]|uniref:Uncharacterized protein n=1 Tax=Gnathostoma spinigerum TaxID=75299 RepID=A0ABD6EFI3_9BILA
MSGGNQQFDILFLNDKYDTIYRFYPQTHITKGDWFIFYEDYHYILGITWSRSPQHVQFKRAPLPGSRIAIRGKLSDMYQFNININNEVGHTKMTITGSPGAHPGTDGFEEDENNVYGYGISVSCSSAYMAIWDDVLFIIEVMKTGIKYYAQGWHLCTFESDHFTPSDVSQITAGGGLTILGYGANTCDYYRY